MKYDELSKEVSYALPIILKIDAVRAWNAGI